LPILPDPTFQAERRAHWDAVAGHTGDRWRASRAYHRRLRAIYRQLVPPGSHVLEIGCGRGDLLGALEPSAGLGVDLSEEMIRHARAAHPELRFVVADAHTLALDERFETIILSDLVNDLWDVQTALERLGPMSHPGTRVIFNFFSRVWELPLSAVRALGLARPLERQNWLTVEDMRGLLSLGGFETIRAWNEVLWPARTPLLEPLANRVLAKLWPLRLLDVTNFLIARPMPGEDAGTPPEGSGTRGRGDAETGSPPRVSLPRVSVIVPARNEAGNIAPILARIPRMGGGTEIIFVEGHSTDDTYATIQKAITDNPALDCKLLRQTGKGKGDAVRLGFAEASGEVLMILDADMTVPPEDLVRFYDAVASGKAEFANGVRLVYPMEQEAMRFLNLLGNKFFSAAFTWLLGQPIKDTLCGTKVLGRADYQRIAANRSYFGDFDPFGDFDLLFGAARLNLKIVDIPIRYRQRTYGTTNISRFRHGMLLLRMTAFAARRLKFV
jgi:SAM-dependent methyltransferase